MDAQRRIVVVAGGDPVPAHVKVPEGAYVIAADSGIDRAAALGVQVDLAVGDFDSVSPAGLAAVIASGATVQRHASAKDATDLELALQAARARSGNGRVLVLGGHGGRLDHFLANVLLLASPAFADLEVDALIGDALLQVVRRHRDLVGLPGELLTLLPVGGAACGVRTAGLRFALSGDDLPTGSSRGVSNEFIGGAASVALDAGTLLAIQPSPSPAAMERLT